MGNKDSRHANDAVDTARLATGIGKELFSQLSNDMFVFRPQATGGVFGGIRNKDSWGRSTPKSWMKAGPPWIKSGGDNWHPDEIILDIGGELSSDMTMRIAKLNGRIILGSAEEKRWRLAFPSEAADACRKMLLDSDIEFLSPVKVGVR